MLEDLKTGWWGRALTGHRVVISVVLAVLPLAGVAILASPAQALVVNQFPVSTTSTASTPGAITMGPDGYLWFTDSGNNSIGRASAGGVTEYPVPTADSGVDGIALGSDGNLWYTESATDKIGMIDPFNPTGDNMDWSITASPDSGPGGITAGPDGDLWITQTATNQIGQFSPSDPSAVTETSIPNSNDCTPGAITAGPDKDLWFTESPNGGSTTSAKIGRIVPATHVVKMFTVGNKESFLEGITTGSDGNLWYIENNDLQSDGALVNSISISGIKGTSPVGFDQGDAVPDAITAGPDGDLWLAESYGGSGSMQNGLGQVLQMTTSENLVSSSLIPSAESEPAGIAPGSDGNVWFTDDSVGDNGYLGNIDRVLLPNFNLTNIFYLPDRNFIPNEVSLTQQGESVSWLGLNPTRDDVTDASGMNLFGSAHTGVPFRIDSTYSFSFMAAGTYKFNSGGGAGAGGAIRRAGATGTTSGKIEVPITVQTLPGSSSTAQVTWASAAPPNSFAFDVEVKTPGSSTWVTWLEGVTSTTATLGPAGDGPYTGPGTYKFRSRIRNTVNGAASGYSPTGSIALS
jgi:virginiamycin B lyase